MQELKLKDEEVARLSQIRDEVGSELEELTASLFEVSDFLSSPLIVILYHKIIIKKTKLFNLYFFFIKSLCLLRKSTILIILKTN